MTLLTLFTIYLATFAAAGAALGNMGLFGPFPAMGWIGRTLWGAAAGLALALSWPFFLVGGMVLP